MLQAIPIGVKPAPQPLPTYNDGDGVWRVRETNDTHVVLVANFSGYTVVQALKDINAIVFQLGKRHIEHHIDYDWDGVNMGRNRGDIALTIPKERAMEMVMCISKVKI